MRAALLVILLVACGTAPAPVALPAPNTPAVSERVTLPTIPVTGIKPDASHTWQIIRDNQIVDTCGENEREFVKLPEQVFPWGSPIWGGDRSFDPAFMFETCNTTLTGSGSYRIDCGTEFGYTPTMTYYSIIRTLYFDGDLSKPQTYQESLSWTGINGRGDCTTMHDVTFN